MPRHIADPGTAPATGLPNLGAAAVGAVFILVGVIRMIVIRRLHPFGDRVHPRRPDRGPGDPDASGLEHCAERGGAADVPATQHEPHPRAGIFQVHEQVPGPPAAHARTGCSVAPRTRIRLVPCPVAAGTQTLAPLSRPAVTKPSASIARARDRGNPAQPGPSRRDADPIPALLSIRHTADGATPMPSPASSPWIRR